jgi:hypothetical protein
MKLQGLLIYKLKKNVPFYQFLRNFGDFNYQKDVYKTNFIRKFLQKLNLSVTFC